MPPIRGVAPSQAVPLRQPPTFGDLTGRTPVAGHRVELRQIGGQWFEINLESNARTLATGRYNFVVQAGRTYGSRYGHLEAAAGERVTFAGQMVFSQGGQLDHWNAGSGSYRPAESFAQQSGLPMNEFRVLPPPAEDLLGGRPPPKSVQLPVFQPGAGKQGSGGPRVEAPVRISGLRAAGRFFAREVPNLALQAVLMLLFPPGVVIRNDKAEELNRTKLDPAIQDALAKQDAKIAELLEVENAPSIYANVTANLDYTVAATSSGDLVLTLEDAAVLGVKASYEDITETPPKFVKAGTLKVTKKVTYSMVLYEPPWVTREKAQKAYEECVREHGGTGFIPPAAGVEAAEARLPNPEEGPCIPPH